MSSSKANHVHVLPSDKLMQFVGALAQERGIEVEFKGTTVHPHEFSHTAKTLCTRFIDRHVANYDVLDAYGDDAVKPYRKHSTIPIFQVGDLRRLEKAKLNTNERFSYCQCDTGKVSCPHFVADVAILRQCIYYLDPRQIANILLGTKHRKAYADYHPFESLKGSYYDGEMEWTTLPDGNVQVTVKGQRPYIHPPTHFLMLGQASVEIAGNKYTLVWDTRFEVMECRVIEIRLYDGDLPCPGFARTEIYNTLTTEMNVLPCVALGSVTVPLEGYKAKVLLHAPSLQQYGSSLIGRLVRPSTITSLSANVRRAVVADHTIPYHLHTPMISDTVSHIIEQNCLANLRIANNVPVGMLEAANQSMSLKPRSWWHLAFTATLSIVGAFVDVNHYIEKIRSWIPAHIKKSVGDLVGSPELPTYTETNISSVSEEFRNSGVVDVEGANLLRDERVVDVPAAFPLFGPEPVWHTTCVQNELAFLESRVLLPLSPVDKAEVAAFRTYVEKVTPAFPFREVDPLDEETYIQQSKWADATKATRLAALEDLRGREYSPGDDNCTAFAKKEAILKPVARPIFEATAARIVASIPICYQLHSNIVSHRGFAVDGVYVYMVCGMTADQIGLAMQQAIDLRRDSMFVMGDDFAMIKDGLFIEDDGSKWDLHIREYLIRMYRRFLQYCFPNYSESASRLCNGKIKYKMFTKTGVVVKRPITSQRSGDLDTSDGNSIMNVFLHLYLNSKYPVNEWSVVAARLGFDQKIVLRPSIHSLEFLSSRPVSTVVREDGYESNQLVLVPKIGRILYKLGQDSHEDHVERVRGVLSSMAPVTAHLPYMRVLSELYGLASGEQDWKDWKRVSDGVVLVEIHSEELDEVYGEGWDEGESEFREVMVDHIKNNQSGVVVDLPCIRQLIAADVALTGEIDDPPVIVH